MRFSCHGHSRWLSSCVLLAVWMTSCLAGMAAADVPVLPAKADAQAGPLRWDRQRIDHRLKPGEQTVSEAFSFVNTGTKPVRITSVESSCGCTVGKPDRDVYAPGEQGEIRVDFKPGSRRGVQSNWIDVRTDAGTGTVRLEFVVVIPELVSVSPRLLTWAAATEIAASGETGDAAAPARKSARLRFERQETGRIEKVEAKAEAAWLRVEIAPAATGDADNEWILTAMPAWHEATLPWRTSIKVTAHTEKAGLVDLRVFVICR